jgi:hypothetical protein
MPQQIISADHAVAIRRKPGSNTLFVNQSAVDVYIDDEGKRLNATVQGVVPSGTKVAANGGQVNWSSYSGVIYARAVTATTIEVQP